MEGALLKSILPPSAIAIHCKNTTRCGVRLFSFRVKAWTCILHIHQLHTLTQPSTSVTVIWSDLYYQSVWQASSHSSLCQRVPWLCIHAGLSTPPGDVVALATPLESNEADCSVKKKHQTRQQLRLFTSV